MLDQGQTTYRFGRFTLSPAKHALCLDEAEVPLGAKSFQVLLYLARNPGRVVTKEELIQAVWADAFIEESNLAQQIFRIRKALEIDPAAAAYIRTTPGVGYQFTPAVVCEALSLTLPNEPPTVQRGAVYTVERVRERTHTVVEELAPAIRFRAVIVASVLTAAAVGGWLIWKKLHAPPAGHHEIVLADFDNQTGDPVFNTVLRTALSVDIRQSPELTLLGSGDAAETLKRMLRPPNEPLRGDVAVEVCRRNNDDAVLAGSIARLETSYLLTLEATDCKSGRQFAAEKAEAHGKDDVVDVLGQLDSKMRLKLGESLRSVQDFDVPLAKSTTSSLDALIAFSQGIHQGYLPSIPFFERAIQLDPNFADAWEDLGVANGEIGNLAVSRAAYIHAYQLRDRVTARERFWLESRYNGIVLNDLEDERKTFELFTRSYPNDDVVLASLADTLREMGRNQDAVEAAKRAHTLGPRNAYANLELAKAYQATGQFEMARTVCKQGLALHYDDPAMHQILQVNDFALRDKTAYEHELAVSKGQDREFQILTLHAQALAAAGQMQEAHRIFEQARANATQQDVKDFSHIDDAEEAMVQALAGHEDVAGALAEKVPTDMQEISVKAALASAIAGDSAKTEKMIAQLLADSTDASDLIRQYWIPILRAVLALHAKEPGRAITLLEPAKAFAPREYWVWSFLGEAYLKTGRGEEAAAQYRQIVDNAGIDPVSAMLPLAHLGLARAYALQNRKAESRAEYEVFFAAWKEADADLPVLKQARAECKVAGGARPQGL